MGLQLETRLLANLKLIQKGDNYVSNYDESCKARDRI